MRSALYCLVMIALVVASGCDLVDPARPSAQPDTEVFGNLTEVDRSPDESDQEVELTAHQKKVLPFIDGERTVTEIMDEAGLVEFDTGKALYGLVQAGFVSRAGERSTSEETGGDEALQQHLNVGIAFYRSGMMEDAAREFEQALEVDPTQARSNFMMGLIAFRRGKLEQALNHFGSMPPGAGNHYAVQRNTALILELLGRYDDALGALDEALVAKPTDADVHLARAIVHVKRGDIPSALDALRLYRTSPEIKRPSPQYYAYTVLASAMSGDLDYAVAVGREGLGHYPDSGPVLVNTGQVLERRGEYEAAAALYNRGTKTNPPLPQAHKNRWDLAYAHGDQEGARAQYEKAVKLAPRLGDDVYLRLGTMAFQSNDRDVALLLWRRALDLNPYNEAVKANLELLAAE